MLILSQLASGEYAADTIVISIPRQVGKTYLIGCIIFALCLMKPGLRVIWTAQVKDTALETFSQFFDMSQRPKVKPHIAKVLQGKGDESILFNNGSSIEFGARDSGFGRGRTDVDVIVFDEGQHLSTEALENMGAAQNVAQNPLCFVMGTPPRPRDKGEFFTLLRQEALEGESDGTLYIEMSADRGADPMDRAQWRKANPSFPRRTSERAMLRLRKKLKNDDSWRREALGVWDEEVGGALPFKAWQKLYDAKAKRGTSPILALDVTEDGAGWLALMWHREDGHVQVLLVNDGDPIPAHKIVKACAGMAKKWNAKVVSPPAFVEELERSGVKVVKTSASDFAVGCRLVEDSIKAATIHHGNQKALNVAVKAAKWRSAGSQGERAFLLKESPEVGPAAAIARGLWALSEHPNYDPLQSAY
jgi:phage terminase large subunit-like protein